MKHPSHSPHHVRARSRYLPIYPATHPDTTLQLALNADIHTGRHSYVKIKEPIILNMAILQHFRGGSRQLHESSLRALRLHVEFNVPDNFLPPSVEVRGQTFGVPPSLDDTFPDHHDVEPYHTLSNELNFVPVPETPHPQSATSPTPVIKPDRPNFEYVDRVRTDHANWLMDLERSKMKGPVQVGVLSRSESVITKPSAQSLEDVAYRSPDVLSVSMASPKDTTPLLRSTQAAGREPNCTVSSDNNEITCSLLGLLAYSLKTVRELIF